MVLTTSTSSSQSFPRLVRETRAVEECGHQTILELSLSGRGLGNPMSIFTPRVTDPLVRIVESVQRCAAELSIPECRSVHSLVVDTLISLGKELIAFSQEEHRLFASGAEQNPLGANGLAICRRWRMCLSLLHKHVSEHYDSMYGDLMTKVVEVEQEQRQLDARLGWKGDSPPEDISAMDLQELRDAAVNDSDRTLIEELISFHRKVGALERAAHGNLPAIARLEQCRDRLASTFVVLDNIADLCARRAQGRDPWFKQSLHVREAALRKPPFIDPQSPITPSSQAP